MDMKKLGSTLPTLVKKYKYPILVLLVGVLLMCIPVSGKEKASQQPLQTQPQEEQDLASQLEDILSQIQGVGSVRVLLTQASGEAYRYQYDESSDRKDTVIITDGDRNQSPVIQQILPPKYLGAVVVCQGAEAPAVKLAVVEAVSRLTGLGADTISVLKMK